MRSLTLTKQNISLLAKEACDVLVRGGIVLYPTDTLYGLGVDATNELSLEKLRALKERPDGKPFSCIVANVDMLERYAHITPLAQKLSSQYLPGALTLILEPIYPFPTSVLHECGVAFRIPKHTFCTELAQRLGRPYTATSANVSGKPNTRNVSDIIEQLGDASSQIDLIIDAGPLLDSLGSTIVDARTDEMQVMRIGDIAL